VPCRAPGSLVPLTTGAPLTPVHDIFDFLGRQPLWPIYVFLGVASMVKYVLPFLPGDTLMLVALFWIGMKAGSWPVAVLAVTVGGFLGAVITFDWGVRAGRAGRKRIKGIGSVAVSVQPMLRRWGWWPLLFNRFVPYVRPFLFPAAGMLDMKRKPVYISAFIGNVLFGIILAAIGYSAGRRYARLNSLFHLYQYWLAIIFLVMVAALLGYLFLIHRNNREEE